MLGRFRSSKPVAPTAPTTHRDSKVVKTFDTGSMRVQA